MSEEILYFIFRVSILNPELAWAIEQWLHSSPAHSSTAWRIITNYSFQTALALIEFCIQQR